MEQTRLEGSSKVAVKEVPFVARIKGARQVAVTGEFTEWSKEGVPLRKGPNGEWRALLELRPGAHQYRLIVDGTWTDDPQATKRVPNPFGGENCVMEITPDR